jgi:alkyl sulfatase BDS1-like metallo-beta-lactamase superfamily hydrolase
MTLIRLLAATCCILVLAGCGTSKSSTPAGGTPPADGTTVSDAKPATEATRPASDDVLKSPPLPDNADVVQAEPGSVATSAKQTIQATSGSTVPRTTAPERLTD